MRRLGAASGRRVVAAWALAAVPPHELQSVAPMHGKHVNTAADKGGPQSDLTAADPDIRSASFEASRSHEDLAQVAWIVSSVSPAEGSRQRERGDHVGWQAGLLCLG